MWLKLEFTQKAIAGTELEAQHSASVCGGVHEIQ